MRARAAIVADSVGGSTRLVTLRCESPLLARQTPAGVYLVNGAAGPLGGDDLAIDVLVGPGAVLTVRSAAAALALPGRDGAQSRLHTYLRVGDGATLSYRPEPLISVRGSDHTVCTTVELAADACLVLLDELVLGRHNEDSGRVRSQLRVVRDGRTLLAHDLDVGGEADAWTSAAVIGSARAVVSMVVIGPEAPSEPRVLLDSARQTSASWLPVGRHAAIQLLLGPTLAAARHAGVALSRTDQSSSRCGVSVGRS